MFFFCVFSILCCNLYDTFFTFSSITIIGKTENGVGIAKLCRMGSFPCFFFPKTALKTLPGTEFPIHTNARWSVFETKRPTWNEAIVSTQNKWKVIGWGLMFQITWFFSAVLCFTTRKAYLLVVFICIVVVKGGEMVLGLRFNYKFATPSDESDF